MAREWEWKKKKETKGNHPRHYRRPSVTSFARRGPVSRISFGPAIIHLYVYARRTVLEMNSGVLTSLQCYTVVPLKCHFGVSLSDPQPPRTAFTYDRRHFHRHYAYIYIYFVCVCILFFAAVLERFSSFLSFLFYFLPSFDRLYIYTHMRSCVCV